MIIDVNNILTDYGKTSLLEEKTIDINNILTKHGKKCILEKKDDDKSSRDRKKDWKKEIYSVIDGIGQNDIFKLNDAYKQEKDDKVLGKFKALKTVLAQFIMVTSKLAKALLLTRHKYYDPSKLADAARFRGPLTDVTGNMAESIRADIEEIDENFKLNFKLDKKLNRIKKQTDDAEDFLSDLVPYMDWVKYSEWADKGDVKSVVDILNIGGANGKLMGYIKKHAEETN